MTPDQLDEMFRPLARQLQEGHMQRGHGYRLTDEEDYAVADPAEVIEFSYPRGTVLCIETSGCLHYGSRGSVKPRFQRMYGYTSVCRTDFSELTMKPKDYPLRESDSRLRKLVLDEHLPAPGQSPTVNETQLPYLMEVLRRLTASTEVREEDFQALVQPLLEQCR
jgi:hypothetical protein